MIKEYNEESLMCHRCTSDDGLRRKIRKSVKRGVCSVCDRQAKYLVSFDELANWVEGIWQLWFGRAPDESCFDPNSDRLSYTQGGDTAELLIGELIGCKCDDDAVTDAIIELLGRGGHYEVMQGGDPLVDDCQYQERKLYREEFGFPWEEFVDSLKHQSRFFNEEAVLFFDRLFSDLEEVRISEESNHFSGGILSAEKKGRPVVTEYSPGRICIYRARKVETDSALSKIMDSPELEMMNPPSVYAAEGRMNPKGVSYFYGANSRDACVAELRPSISEKIVSVEFDLSRSVRLLDLTLLQKGRHRSLVSMFDDDYLEKRIYRELLGRLHDLIAQPVLDGEEFNYLPTQAMSEYLAMKIKPRIDGVIYESVQCKDAKNVVLFPHVLNEGKSAVTVNKKSLVYHNVTHINYKCIELSAEEAKNELLDSYYFDRENSDF